MMRRMRTETRREIDRLIARLNPRAGHVWLRRAASLILAGWLVAGPGATWVANSQPRAAPPNASGHWAFQPVTAPAVPAVKNKHWPRTPIDYFVLAKLEASRLSPSPEAGRVTLIRRLKFDLLGLPPSPPEIAEFVADSSPDAYEKLVERLLASPHYGERWGRHWLDVAGYADSDGYTDADPVRAWTYKYRDYIIRSLNSDKPFDHFIREQLAGDEMVKQPFRNLDADSIDKLTATAFLRMVPDGTASAASEQQKIARNAVVSETLKVVSSSLLGMTVGCAQCHDHRLDPIPQGDYYRMRAIFEPG